MSVSSKALRRSIRNLLIALMLFFMLVQVATALVLFESRMQELSIPQESESVPVLYFGSEIAEESWLQGEQEKDDLLLRHYVDENSKRQQALLSQGLLDTLLLRAVQINQLGSKQGLQVAGFRANRRGKPLFDKLLLLSRNKDGFRWQLPEQLIQEKESLKLIFSSSCAPLVNALQNGVMTFGRGLGVDQLNQAAMNLLGLPQQAAGHKLSSFVLDMKTSPRRQYLQLAARAEDIAALSGPAKKLQVKLEDFNVEWHRRSSLTQMLKELRIGDVHAILVPESLFREYLQQQQLPASDYHVLWGGGMVLQQLLLVNVAYEQQTLTWMKSRARGLNGNAIRPDFIILDVPIDLDHFLRQSLGGELRNEENSP